MRALLDINVLIALHDRDHIHHERAALCRKLLINASHTAYAELQQLLSAA